MITNDQLETSKEIHRRTGRTFYFATRVLPERVRLPTYVLYAFFRIADDVVDDPDPPSPEEQRERLEAIREAGLGERDPEDPVLRAFQELRARYDIDDGEVDEFVDAMAMDVERTRYDTFAELESYLRGSSVAVAYMMVAVMDLHDEERARPHARALGEALQLTNFLRDVREDVVEYGRIYLPRETLEDHGATEAQIEGLEFDDCFAAALREELERAEERYREGVAGIQYLPADCRLAVLAAATLYAEHHRLIRRRGMDVLSDRPTLSTPRRLWVLSRTYIHYRATGDPETTFYRVAPVEERPRHERTVADPGDPPEAATSRGIVGRVAHATKALAGTVLSLVPRWG